MKVVPLDSRLEPVFWEYVYNDIPHYYFFISDMKHDRASTEILLALETKQIQGMMLIFQERIVQLRGTTEAVKALLAQLNIGKAEIQGLPEHKALILDKFREVETTLELTLMTLKRGEETLYTNHPVQKLSTEDAEEIAALLKNADPNWWIEITGEEIAEKMHERLWVGIRVDGQLVSVGGSACDEWGSNISTIATQKSSRNKGYATAVVSTLVDQILDVSNLALIHVESDNTPAVRAYTNVGFRPYRKYFLARTKKKQS